MAGGDTRVGGMVKVMRRGGTEHLWDIMVGAIILDLQRVLLQA